MERIGRDQRLEYYHRPINLPTSRFTHVYRWGKNHAVGRISCKGMERLVYSLKPLSSLVPNPKGKGSLKFYFVKGYLTKVFWGMCVCLWMDGSNWDYTS